MNLVTRVDTARHVDDLVDHCRRAWVTVAGLFSACSWFSDCRYVDIGSGAGLPGLVWSASREANHDTGDQLLVEPREKRAWFLRRTAREMGLKSVTVANCRWGDDVAGTPSARGQTALISLKALHLTDPEILSGVMSSGLLCDVARVVVVRFLGPAPVKSRDMVARYDLECASMFPGWTVEQAAETAGESPSLLLAVYGRN